MWGRAPDVGGNVKHMLSVYWVLMNVGAYKALLQLFIRPSGKRQVHISKQ